MKYFDFSLQCLVMAWVASSISFYIGTTHGFHWFGRSGSLVVLLSVMAEFALLKERNEYVYGRVGGRRVSSEKGVRPLGNLEPNNLHIWKEKSAHISVILGTLIWGYGDLL